MCFWWKKKWGKNKKKGKKDSVINNRDNRNESLKIKGSEVQKRAEKEGDDLLNSKEELKREGITEKSSKFVNSQKEDAGQETNEEVVAITTNHLKLVPSNCQHIGARERQEDAFGFSDFADCDGVNNNEVLAVVADGMGGLACGDQASQVAVNVFLKEYNNKNNVKSIDHFLQRTITIANFAVFDLAFNEGIEGADLGTTLVAVLVHKDKMHWVSAGDSQIFLFRERKMQQLNTEHIYANQLAIDVDKGLISKKEAEQHPERGHLTSYLGLPELYEKDFSTEPVTLSPGDVVLLCSDGLTNTLSIDEIIEILKQPSLNTADKLVEEALSKKKTHQDNITVLVLSCESIKKQSEKKEDENEKDF